jgi:ribosomal protein S18 acetylase RimI-like enzyme
MSKFAEYSPNAKSMPLPDGLLLRAARREDTQDVARIMAEREGEPIGRCLPSIERMLDRAHRGAALLLLATVGDVVAGYGSAGYFIPPEGAPANTVPEGWYLNGVIVCPEYRRCGIGAKLTRARLTWIAQRHSKAFYFASARNLATIDLHKAFGFSELTRDFYYPRVSFEGGVGILFVCEPIPSEL